MNDTLAERLKKAMKGPPKVTGVALAAACKVTTASVSDWMTGKSKAMEGANLITAAKFLGVNSDWLALGRGKMWPENGDTAYQVKEKEVFDYIKPAEHDEWTRAAIEIFTQLKPSQRQGALAALRTHVGNLGHLRNGQALSMAGQKKGAAGNKP